MAAAAIAALPAAARAAAEAEYGLEGRLVSWDTGSAVIRQQGRRFRVPRDALKGYRDLHEGQRVTALVASLDQIVALPARPSNRRRSSTR